MCWCWAAESPCHSAFHSQRALMEHWLVYFIKHRQPADCVHQLSFRSDWGLRSRRSRCTLCRQIRGLTDQTRRRDSMEPPEVEAVAMVNPSFAVRRRFSGPLLLPPISRRHSTQDSRRPPDFEALRSPIPLIKGGARSLETVGDTHSRGQ
ncbi:hypothetical protein JZ751_014238 [Albula glossodonta]|uniref:Uncharacterized protein n=1 Tax=Albula glossodonta TaxID=121402 RepID=A0A8T2P3P2_9TELE|nr:hypothetical protein JZ751_014238 [Albula glossodonta]